MKHYRLEDYDFATLAKAERNKKIYQRLMILAHLKEGMPKAQISQLLFISTDQIYAWLKRFHEQGVEGLKDKARSGRPRLLNSSAHEALKQKIEDNLDLIHRWQNNNKERHAVSTEGSSTYLHNQRGRDKKIAELRAKKQRGFHVKKNSQECWKV